MDSTTEISELVLEDAEAKDPKPKGKSKQYVIGVSKGLGVLLSVALTAYISVQEAISDRPTKSEVRDDIAEVKAAHQEAKAEIKATHKETKAEHGAKIQALDEEIDVVENAVIAISGKVDALDKSVSKGLKAVADELRYLRRKNR